ncbi:cupin domain-containing protein [Streptomyces sp. SYSU K217416]
MLEMKNVREADESRDFPKGHLDVVSLPGMNFGVAKFEPGWRWSDSVRPLAGTDSCQFSHIGFVAEGRLHVLMDDGTEGEAGPGDLFVCSPGHDAWVVGDEAAVVYDMAGEITDYAKPQNA